VMPTFFQSSLLETLRGPEHARAFAHKAMQRSEYSVENVARDLLKEAADGNVYIVLPRSARLMWRLKRWLPLRFLDKVSDLAQRSSPG